MLELRQCRASPGVRQCGNLWPTTAREVKCLGAVTIGGQLAWLLQDSHEDSVYVAAHGRPHVLREVGPPPGADSANLTQWNAVRIPGPPPASQLVTPSQLHAMTGTGVTL